jgi:SAM-dependent methyltransferase
MTVPQAQITPTSPLTFERDHHLRRRIFTEETFHHKARSNLFWLAWLLDQYTDVHETVLDPMGGAGSILLAATKQRPVVVGELETHWCHLLKQNAHQLQTRQLFCERIEFAQWDATKLPLASSSIPAIVTSPPYFDLFSNWNRNHGTAFDGAVGETGLCYGFHPRQLGNVHVYEDYLRAMAKVYLECRRVLVPGGILVLIVGNKVRKGQIVPIVRDTETLCRALRFRFVARHDRATRPSHFRLIHQATQGDDYPLVDTETALVFQKPNRWQPAKQTFALIEPPKPNNTPGRQLLAKQIAYTNQTPFDEVIILTKAGFHPGHHPNVFWVGDHPRKARERREWCYQIVADMVTNRGLTAGDHVDLHVTDRYARYLAQRLTTLGCTTSIPTAHCNLGQKLTWYTERLK